MIHSLLMEYIYLALIGTSVGFVSSFFGIGGGSIMIPLLYILFPKMPAQAIIATSLGTIFLNSGLNTYRYKAQLPPARIVLNMIIATSIGAYLGSKLIYSIPSEVVKKIFAFILIIATIRVFRSKKVDDNNLLKIHDFKVFQTAFGGALISSLTGLGGGILFVPMFMNIVKLPMRLISPYSNLAMTVATLMGLLPHFYKDIVYESELSLINRTFIGHVNPIIILSLFVGAFLFSKIGVRYNNRVEDHTKKYLLCSLLIIFSLKILIF